VKIGQLIRVIRIPEGVTDGPEFKTKTLIERCLGKTFPIADFTNGLVAIDVGELEGKPSYMETVYLEPHCVKTVSENTPH
jgi:hypothetical protein